MKVRSPRFDIEALTRIITNRRERVLREIIQTESGYVNSLKELLKAREGGT